MPLSCRAMPFTLVYSIGVPRAWGASLLFSDGPIYTADGRR